MHLANRKWRVFGGYPPVLLPRIQTPAPAPAPGTHRRVPANCWWVPATVGRYVLQMENYACNVTFYVTLSASSRYLFFSYNTFFTKGATSMLVTFPSILCKTRLRYFFTKFG